MVKSSNDQSGLSELKSPSKFELETFGYGMIRLTWPIINLLHYGMLYGFIWIYGVSLSLYIMQSVWSRRTVTGILPAMDKIPRSCIQAFLSKSDGNLRNMALSSSSNTKTKLLIKYQEFYLSSSIWRNNFRSIILITKSKYKFNNYDQVFSKLNETGKKQLILQMAL